LIPPAQDSLFDQVATSHNIDLGDDDDTEAVHAMIRRIYDIPYARKNVEISDEDLVFCMNVFIIADKYDVPSLREKVVPGFMAEIQSAWYSKEFVECVQKLCGPDAIHLADSALQEAVAGFFINNMSKLTYHDSLVMMIKGDKSFTGRILAGMLEKTSGSTRYLGVCHKPNKSNRATPDCTQKHDVYPDYLKALHNHCVHCGGTGGEVYNKSGGGTAESIISPKIKVILM
jgi:hypothetical protein